jgi:hypothetical protein
MEANDLKSPRSPFGPYANPVDDFAHLPAHVRKLLQSLDEEDCQTSLEIIKNYRRATTIGGFLKWVLYGTLGLFVLGASFGDAITKFAGWFKGV